MRDIFKKILATAMATMITLSTVPVIAAQESDSVKIGVSKILVEENIKPLEKSDWTVCIYMCGTDLESNASAATSDLVEMIAADIPDNVTILVFTGGTKTWNPTKAYEKAVEKGLIEENTYTVPSSEFSQIYRVDDKKMNLVYTYGSNMDMGDVDTAAEFMEFALSYAPSKHLMFEMWDHGGGPLSGVTWDEYTDNFISISDISKLAKAIKDKRGKNTDILGFDTCITSNIETANLLSPYVDYMVASEEVEPGSGWNYDWLDVFDEAYENNVTADSIEIGKRIVDTFRADGEPHDMMTLALVDLSRIPDVVEAFNKISEELEKAYNDSSKYAQIARKTPELQKVYYGQDGLIDLYDFAFVMQPVLNTASELIDVLGTPPEIGENNFTGEVLGENPAVIYRATYTKLDNAIGLAFYYPTIETTIKNTSAAMLYADKYNKVSVNNIYAEYVRKLLIETDKQQCFEGDLITGFNPDTNKHYMKIECKSSPNSIANVDSVYIYSKINEDGTKTDYNLGDRELAVADWENLYFEGEFKGKWYSINDEVFSYKQYCYSDCVLYEIPIVVGDNEFLSYMAVLEFPHLPGVGFIEEIVDVNPETKTADRSFQPSADLTFRTVLRKYDAINQTYNGYDCNDTKISPVEFQDGKYVVNLKSIDLENSKEAIYNVYFRVTDMKEDTHLSEPAVYVLSQEISDFTIAEISPQIYTGKSVEPRVTVMYNGGEIVMDYNIDVIYSNNTEKGTATATVKFDLENLKGEISKDFEIVDVSEIFRDTNEEDWFFDDAAYMHSIGIVYNVDENEFDPDVLIARCEMAILLFHYDVTAAYNGENTLGFKDIDEDVSYMIELLWAKNKGIVKGVSRDEFAPYDTITRAEVVEMLKRFAEYKNYDTSVNDTNMDFADAGDIPNWAEESMAWAVDRGLIKGTDENKIQPNSNITHAEIAAIMHRFNILENFDK